MRAMGNERKGGRCPVIKRHDGGHEGNRIGPIIDAKRVNQKPMPPKKPKKKWKKGRGF